MADNDLISRRALLKDIENGDAPVAGFLIGDWILAQATVDAIPKEEHLRRCAEMYEQGKHDGAIEAETVRRDAMNYEGGNPRLPCKPGDKVYRIIRWGKRNVTIGERVISSVEYNAAGEWVVHSTGIDVLGKGCFLTRKDAERALGLRKTGDTNGST